MTFSITRNHDKGRVTAVFAGHLNDQEGVDSAAQFSKAMGQEEVEAVFDIVDMQSYAPEARQAWQKALWPARRQIRQIILVGGGPLVRIGGVLLAGALSIKLVKVKSRDQIP